MSHGVEGSIFWETQATRAETVKRAEQLPHIFLLNHIRLLPSTFRLPGCIETTRDFNMMRSALLSKLLLEPCAVRFYHANYTVETTAPRAFLQTYTTLFAVHFLPFRALKSTHLRHLSLSHVLMSQLVSLRLSQSLPTTPQRTPHGSNRPLYAPISTKLNQSQDLHI